MATNTCITTKAIVRTTNDASKVHRMKVLMATLASANLTIAIATFAIRHNVPMDRLATIVFKTTDDHEATAVPINLVRSFVNHEPNVAQPGTTFPKIENHKKHN